jgi:hypothetical protein
METSHLRNRAVRQRSRNAKSFRRIGGRSIVAALVGIVMLVAFAGTDAYAAGFVPSLGVASPYAVLGALPGTSAGLSSIRGDLGLAAGSSVSTGDSTSSGLLGTGLLSEVGNLAGSLLGGVTGITNVGNAAASSAEGAASTAYHAAASEAPTNVIAGSELDNVTLAPGVYAAAGPLELAGRVILDARGVRTPEFVFQIPSDLRSAIGAQVILGAGVRPSDVLWQVGGATSLAPNTSLVGTILSDRSISLGAGVKLIGRAISLAGPVNLDRNDIALPLVNAAVGIAAPALSSPTSVVAPSTVGRTTQPVAAALPSLSIGAGLSLPVSLHLLSAPLVTVPTVPTSGSSASGSGTPAVSAPLALPFIPLGDIGVPEIAVPTLPATGVALPSVTTPTSPTTSGSGSSSGSTGAPSTSSSLPLSGLSLPGLTSLLSPSTSAPLSGLSLPSLTVPSVTTPSLSIPHLSTTPSTSTGQGSIARGRVKEGAPAHSSAAAHAKSSSPAASGSTIPSGAPQTGFGGMAGSTAWRVLLSLLALLIAACASTFAVRSHRYQRG